MKKLPFVITPLLALSFLTSCNNKIMAPGSTIDLETATNWVAEHFDTRTNLAKSTVTKVGLSNFKCNGLIYPAIYDDPVPIDRPTLVNLSINNQNFINSEYKNVNGVVGSFITENGYRKTPIVGKGGMDYIINYFLNPFIDSFEIGYSYSLTNYTDKNAFEIRYSLSGDTFYITYYCNDLANITKVIKDASAQDPKMTFAIPFTGTGKATFIAGFDKYGYVTEMLADIHSKAINFHTGLTGGEINNIFYTGEMEGRVSIKNQVSLYNNNRYPHLKFRELDESGNIKSSLSYTASGITSNDDAPSTGKDYCENIGLRLSPYFDMLLPGYGSNVLLNKKVSKVSVAYQGVSYQVYPAPVPPDPDPSLINETQTEGYVIVNTNTGKTVIQFYPETFNLFADDVYVDVTVGE